MNINTLKQELNKKLPRMSEEDLIKFVFELHRVWKNTHNDEKYGDRWKALQTFNKVNKDENM